MMETIAGLNGCGKVLKQALVLSLLLLLICSSVLWAGPMGDPEPVGADNSSAPMGPPPGPDADADNAAVSDIELALLLMGIYF
jgi:hypothetical protein